MASLTLVRDGRPVQVFECLGPLHIGRAATNDIVLLDEAISAHHCVAWTEGDRVWVEDLGSSNGTWANGARITARVELLPGQVVALGGAAGPGLTRGPVERVRAPEALWLVEDTTARVQLPIRTDRFRIGSGADCELRLTDGPPLSATLLSSSAGEIWLGVDDDDRQLAPDESFEVAGRVLRLVAPDAGRPPTVSLDPDRYDYRVKASVGGAVSRAVVEDRRGDPSWAVEDDNRALLLYMLARQFERDRSDTSIPKGLWGWIEDQELVTGVWGRNRPADEINSLNVLIHRVRRGVKAAGLDPWFLEKQRRAVRIRVTEVQLS